jgi:hypothetical protein
MIPAQAALWRKAAVATAFDLRKRLVAGMLQLRQAGAVMTRQVRSGFVRAAIAARAGARALSSVLTQQRHGTWLILFGLLFTLLWLLAGWVGMANGLWRSALVGIVTPLAVSTLFPLRRPVR